MRIDELSLVTALVTTIEEQLSQVRVRRVSLELGERAGMGSELLRDHFVRCTLGTALEGARLDIVVTPGAGLRVLAVELV